MKLGDLKVDVGVPSSDSGAGDDVTGFWSADGERDDRSKDSVLWKNPVIPNLYEKKIKATKLNF